MRCKTHHELRFQKSCLVVCLICYVTWVASLTKAKAQPDALQIYDEMVLAAIVLDKCKLRIEGEVSATKQAQIGKAAYEQILSNLDRENPGRHIENAQQADFDLKRRTEVQWSNYAKMLQNLGCAALEERARHTIELVR